MTNGLNDDTYRSHVVASLPTFEQVHRLIKRADVVGVQHAFEAGLDPNLINRFGWTLLMLTAIQGNMAIGKELVTRGAQIHCANQFGDTALSLAAHAGHEPFVSWLLDNGATSDCRPHGWQLADWIGQTSGLRPEKVERLLTLLGLRPSTITLN